MKNDTEVSVNGEVPERSKGADCNSATKVSKVRILPSPPILRLQCGLCQHSAGVAQLVERQPSKLHVASSTLVSRSMKFLYCSYSSVVEHSLGKGEVSSSNLDKSSRYSLAALLHKISKSRLFSLLFKYWVSSFLGDMSRLSLAQNCVRRKRGK